MSLHTTNEKWPCAVESHQNQRIKDGVDQSIWKVKLLSPQEVLHLKVSYVFLFFIPKVFVAFPVGLQGWSLRNDPKWSKITQRLPHCVLPWCPRFPIYEPFDLQLAGRLAAPHGDPEALAVLLKVRFAGQRGVTENRATKHLEDTERKCVVSSHFEEMPANIVHSFDASEIH